MDKVVQLLNVPNQTLAVRVGPTVLYIALQTHNGILYASVRTEAGNICTSVRCVPNGRITPRSARRLLGGYLAFRCDGDDYPSYEDFGRSCNLVYES